MALRQTQGVIRTKEPNWQPWLLFFLRALQQQKRRLAVKVERERNVMADLSELAIKILDYVRDQGRVTSRDMVREFGASPNTLKATFKALVNKKLLVRHGGGRSTWYRIAIRPKHAGTCRAEVGTHVISPQSEFTRPAHLRLIRNGGLTALRLTTRLA